VPFRLNFTPEAERQLAALERDKGLAKRLKAVRKALGYLELNPKHPSLNTHKYDSLPGPNGAEVFEAYAENNTPAAYRIFWCNWSEGPSGPARQVKRIPVITILSITPHP
jgi:hypothetical protein